MRKACLEIRVPWSEPDLSD